MPKQVGSELLPVTGQHAHWAMSVISYLRCLLLQARPAGTKAAEGGHLREPGQAAGGFVCADGEQGPR